jgi:NADPH:quinone reductase-like Zn-dependent oxidoreductase
VVIDLVGGDVQRRSLSVLKRGILVSAVSKPDADEAKRRGVRAEFILVDVTTAALERIAGMVDAAEIATSVGAVLSLAELRTAHEMVEGMRTRPRGKVVLKS